MNKLYFFAFVLIFLVSVSLSSSKSSNLIKRHFDENEDPRRFIITPDGVLPSCEDIGIVETTFQWTVIVEKKLHMEVLAKGLHPLIQVEEIDELARQHSEDNLFGTQSLVDTGKAARRATILANSLEWLNFTHLEPDPHPAPSVITYIDEIYGTGDSPSSAWYHMKLNNKDILEKDHQYSGVGIYCDQVDEFNAVFWITMILIGTCGNSADVELYYKNTSDPEHCFFCSNVTNNPAYADCLADIDTDAGDSVVLLVDTDPDPDVVVTEGVCCSWATLNASNEVPETDYTYTGQVVSTLYLSDSSNYLCFEIEHDIPLTGGDQLTAVHIHFGAAGQETESLEVHAVDSTLFDTVIRDCWDFNTNGGQTYQSVAKGNFYIHLHNADSDLDSNFNGAIRAQLGCEAAAALFNTTSSGTC